MGRGKQEQPQRLAEKLRQIRLSLEMTAGVSRETLDDDKLELPESL